MPILKNFRRKSSRPTFPPPAGDDAAAPPRTPTSRPGSGSTASDTIFSNSDCNNDTSSKNTDPIFCAVVPAGCNPGESFQVNVGSRIVRIVCPLDSHEGESIRFTVPFIDDDADHITSGQEHHYHHHHHHYQRHHYDNDNDYIHHENNRHHAASLSSSSSQWRENSSPNVTKIPPDDNNYYLDHDEKDAYMVTIPEGVEGGGKFPVLINGRNLMVTCPISATAGMSVRVVVPRTSNGNNVHHQQQQQQQHHQQPPPPQHQQHPQHHRHKKKNNQDNNTFEVIVPNGVKPGQPFTLLAGGVRVLVTCPTNASPGQKIRFELPSGLLSRHHHHHPSGNMSSSSTSSINNIKQSKLAEIKLKYDNKDGWMRTLRATDMKFQWTRFDKKGGVDTRTRFNVDRSAYVLRLDRNDNNSNGDATKYKRCCKGYCSLVTPDKGVIDSQLEDESGSTIVTCRDIALAQSLTFEGKTKWLYDVLQRLHSPNDEGLFMKMNIRRDHLIEDSMEAVMSLSRKELRKKWRFDFISSGEEGIDFGGLAKEWFNLVTMEIFNPEMGLWLTSSCNQMSLQINPASEISCPGEHLIYFRFLGRVLGKAVIDGQVVNGHMVKHLYKHILRWPIMFHDLKDIDEEYHNSLKSLIDLDADALKESVDMDFTVVEDLFGHKEIIELVPNGASIEVTKENLPEYIEACLKYRVLGRCQAQVTELLLGFSDVVPAALLTIFDFQELELLMCGVPNIDMDDWQINSDYSGEFEFLGPHHDVCKWFWEVVSEYDDELKARLLQFTTGTSGVPAGGFGMLKGHDGGIQRFTINGITLESSVLPKSHTCFNRIDLPLYESRRDLKKNLMIAITMAASGFGAE